jgi:hypothetical protein
MVTFFTSSNVHRPLTSGHTPIYHEATKYVSSWVGHECLPEDRTARETSYSEALNYVNSFCDLGLEKQDIELFSLYFTALSDSRRFGGEKSMNKEQGENPATHSIQAVCLKQRVFDEAAESNPSTSPAAKAEHLRHSQMTGIAVLTHDMGEVLGEFTTAAQRMKDETLKEDPRAEQVIFRYVLRLALQAQASGDREGFYRRVSELRGQVKLTKEDGSAAGIPKSSEYLQQFLQPQITLAPEQEARFETLAAFWDMAEGFEHPLHNKWQEEGINVGFVQQLTKSIDHVQGTRHLVRMARTGNIADAAGKSEERADLAHIDDARAAGNIKYSEPEAGPLFAAIKTGQRTLEAIARRQVAFVYQTMSDFMDVVPPVPLGHQIVQTGSAVINPEAPFARPETPTMSEIKRAQGALRGLYERAAAAALRGEFTPTMVDNGKGGTRSQMLGIDGLTLAQQEALYAGKATSQGRGFV